MSYTQLTREQRYQIYALHKANHSQTEMASIVGCHKSTIAREVARNGGQRGYRPRQQAQELALGRKLRARRPRIQSATWTLVESWLRQPVESRTDFGAARTGAAGGRQPRAHLSAPLSRQARGGHASSESALPESTPQALQGRDRRGQLPVRRSIDARPAVVAAKRRLGDEEADTSLASMGVGE